MNGSIGKTRGTVAARNLAAEHGPHGAMYVADIEAAGHGRLRFERGFRLRNESVVERRAEPVILTGGAATRNTRRQLGLIKDRREIDALRLPVGIVNVHVDLFHVADHFVDATEAKLGHVLAHLLGDEEEEVDDVLRCAGEALAQNGILGGDADRAGIQVALAHHNAAH